jgi:hypothetical protein
MITRINVADKLAATHTATTREAIRETTASHIRPQR